MGARWWIWTLALWPGLSHALDWNPVAAWREMKARESAVQEVRSRLEAMPDFRRVAQTHERLGFHGRGEASAWIEVDLGRVCEPEALVLFPARSGDQEEDGFPGRIRCRMSGDADDDAWQTIAEWKEARAGAGARLPFLRLPLERASGRRLRIEVADMRPRRRGAGNYFALGEIVVLEKGSNVALGCEVRHSEAILNPPRWQAANLTDGFVWCGLLNGAAGSPSNGFHSEIEPAPGTGSKWVEVRLPEAVPVDEVRLIPARPQDFADVAGFGFPPRLRVMAFRGKKVVAGPLENGAEVFPNPGDSMVCLPMRDTGTGPVMADRVRVEVLELWQRSGDYIFALGELEVWSRGVNAALGAEVAASDTVRVASGMWTREALVDGFSSQARLMGWTEWLAVMGERMKLEARAAEMEYQMERATGGIVGALLNLTALVLVFVVAAVLVIGIWQRRRARDGRRQMKERIARDLHDEVGSQLSHLALLADLTRSEPGLSESARRRLDELSAGARETLGSMRDLVWLLHPPAGGGWAAFEDLVRQTVERLLGPVTAELKVEKKGEPPAGGQPEVEWSRDVLLWVKEAAANCARHSRAAKVRFELEWEDGALGLRFRDDGVGFDEADAAFRPGAGLRNLRRRAEALGGKMTLDSRPGQGTEVGLKAPFKGGKGR